MSGCRIHSSSTQPTPAAIFSLKTSAILSLKTSPTPPRHNYRPTVVVTDEIGIDSQICSDRDAIRASDY